MPVPEEISEFMEKMLPAAYAASPLRLHTCITNISRRLHIRAETPDTMSESSYESLQTVCIAAIPKSTVLGSPRKLILTFALPFLLSTVSIKPSSPRRGPEVTTILSSFV